MEINGLQVLVLLHFYSYQIQKSVRIDKADQSYLQYPTGMSSTNNTKYSENLCKRGQIGISRQ